jgi:hypothetical protein
MGPFADRRNIPKRTKSRKVGPHYRWCSHPNVVGLDRFFSRKNIGFYRSLANKRTKAAKRREILRLLAEEQVKFKLEFMKRVAETNQF